MCREESPESGRGNLAPTRLPPLNAPQGGFHHPAGFNPDRRASLTDLSQYKSSAPPPLPPTATTVGPTAGYAFGASFGPGAVPPPAPYTNSATMNYRPLNAPSDASFYDYSIRRHSLSGAGGNPNSPPRTVSINSSTVNSPVLKRKNSDQDELADSYSYPAPGNYLPPSSNNGNYPKRRGSSLAYDKVNLTEQLARRESRGVQAQNGWDEDRRAAQMYGGGVAGQVLDSRVYAGGHGMSGQDYSRQPSNFASQQPQPPPPRQHLPESYDDNSAPRMHESDYASRRPNSSNGLPPPPPPMYSAPTGPPYPLPNRAPPLYAIPSQPPPEPRRNVVPNNPPPSTSARFNGAYANLPPASAAWARAGPLPPVAIPQSRPGSGNLDPASAYSGKDTPYSRSPELRVSHKLAERKRRKEMAQLFDDLRDSLPVDRGLKSSKWEILTKAVEYIGTVKEYNADLVRDTTILREHFGLGPGPQPPASLGIVSNANLLPSADPHHPAPAPQSSSAAPTATPRLGNRTRSSSANLTRANSQNGSVKRKSSEEYEDEDDDDE